MNFFVHTPFNKIFILLYANDSNYYQQYWQWLMTKMWKRCWIFVHCLFPPSYPNIILFDHDANFCVMDPLHRRFFPPYPGGGGGGDGTAAAAGAGDPQAWHRRVRHRARTNRKLLILFLTEAISVTRWYLYWLYPKRWGCRVGG